MKQDIFAFMDKHSFCTMATVTAEGLPEAAFLGFSQNESLEIVIGTSRMTRKYKNLQSNPRVAVVIADSEAEVQYEGIAQEITDVEYAHIVEGQHFAKLPGAAKYREDSNQTYIKISPTWLRFIQHTEGNKVTEMTEF